MNARIVGLSRFVAAASATVITAVNAWAFVSSSASIERDPFQFASIMAANAKMLVGLLRRRRVALDRGPQQPPRPETLWFGCAWAGESVICLQQPALRSGTVGSAPLW